mmetsp:Transcript_49404/g.127355  ORF Transcript_49404/g.127355 Transcript_49404/m.127355 type:complete len:207 (-) Transcript_49404:687-1307(-)
MQSCRCYCHLIREREFFLSLPLPSWFSPSFLPTLCVPLPQPQRSRRTLPPMQQCAFLAAFFAFSTWISLFYVSLLSPLPCWRRRLVQPPLRPGTPPMPFQFHFCSCRPAWQLRSLQQLPSSSSPLQPPSPFRGQFCLPLPPHPRRQGRSAANLKRQPRPVSPLLLPLLVPQPQLSSQLLPHSSDEKAPTRQRQRTAFSFALSLQLR